MEGAGISTYSKRSGPGRWNNYPGADRAVADKAQNYCPRLEGLVLGF